MPAVQESVVDASWDGLKYTQSILAKGARRGSPSWSTNSSCPYSGEGAHAVLLLWQASSLEYLPSLRLFAI